MLRKAPRWLPRIIASLSLVGLTQQALAAGFGIYESEALALGGAAVAIASPGNAVFYNPALLAQHRFNEDEGRHGRMYLPALALQTTPAAEELYDVDDNDLADRLTDSVDEFNQAVGQADSQAVMDSAGRVVDVSRQLLSSLDEVRDEPLYLDSFTGLVVAEPGNGQGGAFYLGGRVLGEGDLTEIQQADLDLLQDYVDGLDFVASGGQSGEPHPELFDGSGDLVDPRAQLTSSASGAGAVIAEMGVAMAKEFTLSGQNIAFGITPKVMLIKAYSAELDVAEGEASTERDQRWRRRLDADIGVASKIGAFNIALAVKDLFGQTLSTPAGGELQIKPKPRLGIGYLGTHFKVGLDYDMVPIDPLVTGPAVQNWALGVAWQPHARVALRAGYREDIRNDLGNAISAGVGVNWGRLLLDISYVDGDSTAAALQIGYKL